MFSPTIQNVALEGVTKIGGRPFFTLSDVEPLLFNQVAAQTGSLIGRFPPDAIIGLTHSEDYGWTIDSPNELIYKASLILLRPHYQSFNPNRDDSLREISLDEARQNYMKQLDAIFTAVEGHEFFWQIIREKLSFDDSGTELAFRNGSILSRLGLASTYHQVQFLTSELGYIARGARKIVDEKVNADPIIRTLVDQEYLKQEYLELEPEEIGRQKEALIRKILGSEDEQLKWITRGIFLRILKNSTKLEEVLIQQELFLTHELLDLILSRFTPLFEADPENYLNLLMSLVDQLRFFNTTKPRVAEAGPEDNLTKFEWRLPFSQRQILFFALGEEEFTPSGTYRSRIPVIFADIEASSWTFYGKYLQAAARRFKKGSPEEAAAQLRANEVLFRLYVECVRTRDNLMIDTPLSIMPNRFLDIEPADAAQDEEVMQVVKELFKLSSLGHRDQYIDTPKRQMNGHRKLAPTPKGIKPPSEDSPQF